MPSEKAKAVETSEFIRSNAPTRPIVGILMGTGLGESLSSLEIRATWGYESLPHFPVSTVESHSGRLLAGTLSGKEVIAMQGRFHLYEGYSPQEVTFPIRVMQELGVETLIVTNAAGGLNLSFDSGDIMVIRDHINLTGENPLVGPNEDSWGLRFPHMIEAYDKNLGDAATAAGKRLGMDIREGVYTGLKGPSLETPAEMRYLRRIGGDAVGFSTIMEVIAGRHAGMRVLGLSMVTNINDPDNPEPATLEGVIGAAEKSAPDLDRLIQAAVEGIDAQ